ncbi:MAG: hypothetical protein AAB408_01760 [Patescibacteria group bacterium]
MPEGKNFFRITTLITLCVALLFIIISPGTKKYCGLFSGTTPNRCANHEFLCVSKKNCFLDSNGGDIVFTSCDETTPYICRSKPDDWFTRVRINTEKNLKKYINKKLFYGQEVH